MRLQLTNKSIVKAVALFGVIFLLVTIFLPVHAQAGWVAGYSLGLLAVVLHYGMSLLTKQIDDELFVRYFFVGLAVRFITILALFILLIISEKFDQISFTVSFLISYIFHSVIDTILLNKKLTDRSG